MEKNNRRIRLKKFCYVWDGLELHYGGKVIYNVNKNIFIRYIVPLVYTEEILPYELARWITPFRFPSGKLHIVDYPLDTGSLDRMVKLLNSLYAKNI